MNKRFLLGAVATLAIGILAAFGETPPLPARVALMDFSTDDNSYRSAQVAADFTGLLQVQLASEPGVEWVERAQLDKARQELELSAMELVGGGSSIRRGKWVKADWMITGQFSLDDQNRRTLFLEVTDLQHADVLANKTITFPGVTTPQFQTDTNHVDIVVGALHQLLTEAHLRQQQTTGKILVAPLFLADVAGSGFSKGNGALEQGFDDALEHAVATNSRVRLIRFPKAYRSTEESEMVLDGLVEADRNAWQQTADLYVWGTYSKVRKMAPGRPPEEETEIILHLWDGASQPTIAKEELPCSFSGDVPPDQLEAALNRLASQVMAHARKHTAQSASENLRHEIAESLVQTYNQMSNPTGHFSKELQLTAPEKFLQAVHMLETACFFDPDNANARVLYITCRWGWWMDFGSNVKNEFWSKWRRSQAWENYVNRFGLKAVNVELPFPYNMNGGIPAMYVRSVEDVLGMFPQWHSTEEMGLEDEWRQQGVHTWLMEAELHGFPKEMPHELAMKWKTETEAERDRRKKLVAEFSRSTASETNLPGKIPGSLPGGISSPAQSVFRASPPPERKLSAPPSGQASREMVPAPAWLKEIYRAYSMFRLAPPNVLPFEVKPEFKEIHFPKQFEVQSVLQMDFLQDKLLILAMDERSAQSSDVNPDLSAEMLDKHNRLWILEPGATTPVLYEPELFPQSVHAFLLKDDCLWVAGKTTGYLDLKTGKFHKYGLADGFALQISDVFGGANGHIFVAGDDSRISMFDPQASRWNNLALPPAQLAWGTGSPFLLAGEKHWLGYVAGTALIHDVVHNTWTNLPEMNSVQHIVADDAGFWFGCGDGLRFYDPVGKSFKRWTTAEWIQGMMNPLGRIPYTGDPTISQATLNGADEQIQSTVKGFGRSCAHARVAKRENKVDVDPLHLDWRMPGGVTAMADDGDFLWLGVGNYFGNYLLLLHKSSDSLVACFVMPVRDKISGLAVSETSVWIGTAYGDHKLLQLPKSSFLSVPQSRWVNLAISPQERARLIRGMTDRDQAMYAFYAGDDARVTELLADINPDKASLEEMFVLAFSYDASGQDKPELAHAWFEHIISRYPVSPWAKAAQAALAENEENHKIRAHEEELLAKYDRNHNGVLDPEERRAMELDPDYQQKKKTWDADQLDIRLKEIMQKFDLNGDGKLDREELELLKAQITLFSQASPEMLTGHKILVAPLISENFPSVSTILQRYDTNHDGGLNVGELKALAQDIQKGR